MASIIFCIASDNIGNTCKMSHNVVLQLFLEIVCCKGFVKHEERGGRKQSAPNECLSLHWVFEKYKKKGSSPSTFDMWTSLEVFELLDTKSSRQMISYARAVKVFYLWFFSLCPADSS